MEHTEEERVADRINSEPPNFRGCFTTELLAIALLATVFWLPTNLLISTFFWAITMGLGATGVGVVATVVVSASVFKRSRMVNPMDITNNEHVSGYRNISKLLHVWYCDLILGT